jgi:RNA polymerase sigma-70 factor (ECF subfamily)
MRAKAPEIDLASVIRRVQEGDVEAFIVVVRSYQRSLRAWASRWCVPGIEADDIVQCAFIIAFKKIHAFTADGNCFAWLCAIARNVLSDELKRLRRERSRVHNDLVAVEQVAALQDLEADGDDQRRMEALRACVQQLPGTGEELVRRHYAECESLAKIAEQQCKTLAAVKARLHWLRSKLRDCLAQKLAEAAS